MAPSTLSHGCLIHDITVHVGFENKSYERNYGYGKKQSPNFGGDVHCALCTDANIITYPE